MWNKGYCCNYSEDFISSFFSDTPKFTNKNKITRKSAVCVQNKFPKIMLCNPLLYIQDISKNRTWRYIYGKNQPIQINAWSPLSYTPQHEAHLCSNWSYLLPKQPNIKLKTKLFVAMEQKQQSSRQLHIAHVKLSNTTAWGVYENSKLNPPWV